MGSAYVDIAVVMLEPELPCGESIAVTRSAVARYHHSVRPTLLNYDATAVELDRALSAFGELGPVPAWVLPAAHGEGLADTIARWVMLGPDVAFPLVEDCATTCVVHGCISPEVRAHRRAHRARHAAAVRERPVLGFKRSGDRIGRRPLHEFAQDELS